MANACQPMLLPARPICSVHVLSGRSSPSTEDIH